MEPADDNVPGAAANIPPLPPGTGRTGPLPHQLCLSDRPINSDREEFLAARAPGAAPWQSRAGSGSSGMFRQNQGSLPPRFPISALCLADSETCQKSLAQPTASAPFPSLFPTAFPLQVAVPVVCGDLRMRELQGFLLAGGRAAAEASWWAQQS